MECFLCGLRPSWNQHSRYGLCFSFSSLLFLLLPFFPVSLSLPPSLSSVCDSPTVLDLDSKLDAVIPLEQLATPVILLQAPLLSPQVPALVRRASSRLMIRNPHLHQQLASQDSASYSLGSCFYLFALPLSCRILANSPLRASSCYHFHGGRKETRDPEIHR